MYRAEAFGMLSLHRFLIRLQETQPETGQCMQAPHLVCDNQGLVKTRDKIAQHTQLFPNTMMEAEWDVLAQILEAIRTLRTATPTIEHIKGH